MTNQWAGVQDIDCQTDPNLPPGSCITTGNGVLDKLAIDQVSKLKGYVVFHYLLFRTTSCATS